MCVSVASLDAARPKPGIQLLMLIPPMSMVSHVKLMCMTQVRQGPGDQRDEGHSLLIELQQTIKSGLAIQRD